MAGRLIDNFSMRRPRDMDPESDGLHQALLGRKIIVSREAFFDLKAKFDAYDGAEPGNLGHRSIHIGRL